MSTSVRANIEDFLSYRRLAMVGVSRNHSDFSRALFRELQNRGYDMVPVNPNAADVEGVPCFKSVGEIAPCVDGALLMTPAGLTNDVLEECAKAGVRRVWLYKAVGTGAMTPEALRFCEQHRISVIPGECPFMFLAGAGWIHSVHRFCRKAVGTFPA